MPGHHPLFGETYVTYLCQLRSARLGVNDSELLVQVMNMLQKLVGIPFLDVFGMDSMFIGNDLNAKVRNLGHQRTSNVALLVINNENFCHFDPSFRDIS